MACSSIRNKSTRLPTAKSVVPGPGKYQILKYMSTGYQNGRKIGEKYKNRPTSSFSRPRTANYRQQKAYKQSGTLSQLNKNRSRAISAKISSTPQYGINPSTFRPEIGLGDLQDLSNLEQLQESGDIVLLTSNTQRTQNGINFADEGQSESKLPGGWNLSKTMSGMMEQQPRTGENYENTTSDVKFSRKEPQIREDYRNKSKSIKSTQKLLTTSKSGSIQNQKLQSMNQPRKQRRPRVQSAIHGGNVRQKYNQRAAHRLATAQDKNGDKLERYLKESESTARVQNNFKIKKDVKIVSRPPTGKKYHKIHPQLNAEPIDVPFNSHTSKHEPVNHLQIKKNPPYGQTDEYLGPGTYLPPDQATPFYPEIGVVDKLPASDHMFLSVTSKGLTQQVPNYLKWTMFEQDNRQIGDTDIRFGVVAAKKKDFRCRDFDVEKKVFLA